MMVAKHIGTLAMACRCFGKGGSALTESPPYDDTQFQREADLMMERYAAHCSIRH